MSAAPITALYAAFHVLLAFTLATRVIRLRLQHRVGLGDGGNEALGRAIRVHGNNMEYVPLALVAILVAEVNGASSLLVHACGIMLTLGRLLHAWGLGHSSGPSVGRTGGTVLSWAALFTAATGGAIAGLA